MASFTTQPIPIPPASNAELANRLANLQVKLASKVADVTITPSSTLPKPLALPACRAEPQSSEPAQTSRYGKGSVALPFSKDPVHVPEPGRGENFASISSIPASSASSEPPKGRLPPLPEGVYVRAAATSDASAASSVADGTLHGWVTYRRADGTPYFYHAQSGTTSWDWRMPLEPYVVKVVPPSPPRREVACLAAAALPARAAAPPPAAAPPAAVAAGEPSRRAIAPGDPSLPWTAADWDLVLVLPMADEDIDEGAGEGVGAPPARISDKASGNKAGKRRPLTASLYAPQLSAERRERLMEHELRVALQMEGSDTAADGSGQLRSSDAWVAAELRRRVLAAGLACKVLKLLPITTDCH